MRRRLSKKIRAVNELKASQGRRVASAVAYGYKKIEGDKEQWYIDEPSGAGGAKDICSLPCRERADADRTAAGKRKGFDANSIFSLDWQKDEQSRSGKYLRLARKHSRAYFGKPAVHGLHGEREILDGQLQGA